MVSTTAAGTSIAISSGTPATQDAAGFGALTYVEIGQVEKLGTIGAAFAKVEFQPLKGVKQKHKGAADYGSLQPSMAYDQADAGQTLLRTAAADETAKRYAFRVTFPTGAIRYFLARVFGAPENIDGADSILMSMPTVEISSRVVSVSGGSGTPTPTPAPTARMQATDRSAMPQATTNVANSSSNTQIGDQMSLVMLRDETELVVTEGNFYAPSAAATSLNGLSAVTYRRAFYDGTTYYPLFSGGSRDLTVQPGQTASWDPVAITLKKGQSLVLISLKTFASAPANFPGSTVPFSNARDLSEAGTALTDRTGSGGFTAATRVSTVAILPPLAIRGAVRAKGVSVCVLGDSISTAGASDADTNRAERGYVQRAFAAASVPFVVSGQTSLKAADVAANSTILAQYLQPAVSAGVSHIYLALGINDAQARTASQIYADLQTIANAAKAAISGVKVVLATLTPKTNAANTGQSGSDTTTWATRLTLNQMIRDNNGIGDGYFDAAAAMQSSADANLWRSDLLTATTITLNDGGVNNLSGDLVETDIGLVVQTGGSNGQPATAVSIRGGQGGGFLAAPSGPALEEMRQNSGTVYTATTGSGLKVNVTATGAVATPSDGLHPTAGMHSYLKQVLRNAVPTLFASSASTLTPLSSNVFLMGDSRIASVYNDVSNRNNKNAGNHLVAANTQMGQRMVFVGTAAVAGQRSDQYNSGTSAMTASSAPTVIVFGVVNDIAYGRTGAESWSTVKGIIDAAIAAGKSVIAHTEPGSSTFTPTMIGYRNDFNTALLAYAAANPQKIRVFDFAGTVLVDPSRTDAVVFKTNYYYVEPDGTTQVHLSKIGARAVGNAFSAWSDANIGGTRKATAASSLVTNPGFTAGTGAATGFTGSPPTSWAVVRTGSATGTISYGSNPSGAGNELIIAGTATAAGERVQVSQQITGTFALGDVARLLAEVAVDAGSSNLRSVRAYVSGWFNSLQSSVIKYDMQPLAGDGLSPATAFVDLLSPDDLTLNMNGATTLDRVDVTIAMEFGGAGSATMRVRQPTLLKV